MRYFHSILLQISTMTFTRNILRSCRLKLDKSKFTGIIILLTLLPNACRRAGSSELVNNRDSIVLLSKQRELATLWAARIQSSKIDHNSRSYLNARSLYDRAYVENNAYVELLAICISNDCGKKPNPSLERQAKLAASASYDYFKLLGLVPDTQDTMPLSSKETEQLRRSIGSANLVANPIVYLEIVKALSEIPDKTYNIFSRYRTQSAEERLAGAERFKNDYRWVRWEDAK